VARPIDVGSQPGIAAASRTPTIEEQRGCWEWHWQNWRERKAINEWVLKRGERVLQILDSLALVHPTILDLGCGMGWFCNELSRFGSVTGIDISEEAIAKAKATYPRITFVAGNALTHPLPAARFDVVVSQEVLAHVDDQAKFVEVAATALRPGGYFIVTTANKFVTDRLATGWDPWPAQHLERFVDRRGLRRLLSWHFRVLRTTSMIFVGDSGILRLVNSHKLTRALGLLMLSGYLEAWKERAGLGYSLIALAQKKDPGR